MNKRVAAELAVFGTTSIPTADRVVRSHEYGQVYARSLESTVHTRYNTRFGDRWDERQRTKPVAYGTGYAPTSACFISASAQASHLQATIPIPLETLNDSYKSTKAAAPASTHATQTKASL